MPRSKRKHHRMGCLKQRGIGSLLIAGVIGIALGAGGYYVYLARKSNTTGLLNVQRY